MNTNLIDNYVSEVGRRLPRKNRADIEAEIRSVLQDMLEERSQKADKPVEDEMILGVLKTYGAPEKVAATYQGERYLIGPRLYPIFRLVLRIVLIVGAVLVVVMMGVAIARTPGTPQSAIGTILMALGNYIVYMLTALGNIVLIFAILEWALFRAGTKIDLKGLPKEKDWEPRSLLKISAPNQVKMVDTIIEIVGAFAAIVVFNFYPQIIGFGYFSNGNWYVGAGSAPSVPLLSEAFFYFVPYLTLVWVLTMLLDIILLRMGHWTVVTRICLIGLKIVNIVIAAGMLGVPSLLAITTTSLTSVLGNAQAAQTLMTMISLFIRVALWLAIFGNTVEIIRAVSRIVSNNILPQATGKS